MSGEGREQRVHLRDIRTRKGPLRTGLVVFGGGGGSSFLETEEWTKGVK